MEVRLASLFKCSCFFVLRAKWQPINIFVAYATTSAEIENVMQAKHRTHNWLVEAANHEFDTAVLF